MAFAGIDSFGHPCPAGAAPTATGCLALLHLCWLRDLLAFFGIGFNRVGASFRISCTSERQPQFGTCCSLMRQPEIKKHKTTACHVATRKLPQVLVGGIWKSPLPRLSSRSMLGLVESSAVAFNLFAPQIRTLWLLWHVGLHAKEVAPEPEAQ